MLKRRSFVRGGASLLAGQAIPAQLANAQGDTGRVILRTSKLYNSPEAVRRLTITESMIISIFGDSSRNRFGIGATSLNGDPLWQHELPPATYSGVGTAQSGKLVLLYALNYVVGENRKFAGCVLSLDPATGAIKLLEDVSTRIRTQLYFAEDSFLVSAGRDGVQLWTLNSALRLEKRGPTTNIDASYVHLDLLSRGLVSLLDREGTTLHTISIPDGIVSRHQVVASPVLDEARTLAQTIRANTGMSSDVRMPILSVTGSDHNGTLYGLVLPTPIGVPAPMIAISASGVVSSWGSCQMPPFGGSLGSASKIVKLGTQLGIIYSSGTIGWYQA